MKTKSLFLSLPFFLFTLIASADDKSVTLKGLVTGLDVKKAVIGFVGSSREAVLTEGQALNGVAVTGIDAENGTVNLVVNGEKCSLAWEQNNHGGSTNKADGTAQPSIRLRSVTLQTAINLYAVEKERTVLQHPLLKEHAFSLVLQPVGKAEAAEAFEKMFAEQGVATIPDGEHFVMIVPFSLTNTVTPRADGITQINSFVPALSLNFWQAPISMALSAYADFVGKKILNPNEAPPRSMITLTQTTPLSKEEILYAFETLFAWNQIRLVPEGNDLKVGRIQESK